MIDGIILEKRVRMGLIEQKDFKPMKQKYPSITRTHCEKMEDDSGLM